MRVVEVIPIVKGITKPTLSYFTKDSYASGQFVKIPVRKGTTLGVVAQSTDARKTKSSLRSASFALRKLTKVEKAGSISESFMRAASATAYFYGATSGSVLSSLIPKKFLEKPELLGKAIPRKSDLAREIKVIQLAHAERFREYRSIVRENFARGKSVLFIVPTQDEVTSSVELLSLGIEPFVYTAKQFAEAKADEHPVLFITTPSHIVFDRSDLDTILIERENSRAYRVLSRPFINIKKFLELYAKERGVTLILGDTVLSLETLWREREGTFVEFSPLSWRLKFSSAAEIIDMRKEKHFEVFSPELKSAINAALAENRKTFLFALRKGLSATTVCGDCGSILLCKNCRSPMVLHSGDPNIYICHHCSAKRSAETTCDTCGGWKLTPLGIGIDRVKDEARTLFPDATIVVIDKDHTKTAAQIAAALKKFERSSKAILIGTELALHHLDHVSVAAAVTLDSLFSIPDFGINERLFYLVTKLRELAKDTLIIQSRNAGESVLGHAVSGNVLDFYREEIRERQEIMYPPYSLFIKVTTTGTRDRIEKKAAHLQSLFADFEPHFTLGRELSMTIRLPRAEWPNEEVVEKLLLLTPEFLIKVDPESIL